MISSTSVAVEPVRVCNGEWPPYMSESLKHYGVGSRIVSEAFASQGVEVEYDFLPWKRGLSYAREGFRDGTIGWLRRPDKERHFWYSDPIFSTKWVFLHLKEKDFEWRTVSDLAGLKVGAIIGNTYTAEFRAAENAGTIKVVRIKNEASAMKMLLSGRIDVYPTDIHVAYSTLSKWFSQESINKLTYHPHPLMDEPTFLLLSKKIPRNRSIITIFNKGLQALKASGQYEAYLSELDVVPLSRHSKPNQ
nr:transporter substrate-binding domain-containing protein [Marinibactrum halimedae]